MKKYHKTYLIWAVVSTLLLTTCGMSLGISCHIEHMPVQTEEQTKETAPMSLSHEGEARFGIIAIETPLAEGFPDEFYIGVLKNVNVTLHGATSFIVAPIPFIFFATTFETENMIQLTMDFFWGPVDYTENSTYITGFGRMISWKW
jgi:hypothetical protein